MNPPGSLSPPPAAPWDAVLQLPFGRLGVHCSEHELLYTEYLVGEAARTPATAPGSALLREVQAQLLAYCRDPGFRPDLPLAARGTPFQRRVWAAMCEIPPGRTRSYGDVARELDSAARAVGQACGANPFAPLVPCHRVVGGKGLGGFAHSSDEDGELLGIKRWLLRHEGALPAGGRGLFDA